MLVDDAGLFITQREAPELARTRVRDAGHGFVVSAEGHPELSLEFQPTGGERISVRVWDDLTEGSVQPDGSRWFSELLERDVRLVFMPSEVERAVDPDYGSPDDVVGFADGFPLLVLSQASLDELSRRVGRPLEMRRFRPNLVVSGGEAHAEDEWRRLRVGEVRLRLVKPCSRCVITTLDPATGESGKEPLATLATYRKRDGKVYFGMNAIPDAEGEIRIGDPVVPE